MDHVVNIDSTNETCDYRSLPFAVAGEHGEKDEGNMCGWNHTEAFRRSNACESLSVLPPQTSQMFDSGFLCMCVSVCFCMCLNTYWGGTATD